MTTESYYEQRNVAANDVYAYQGSGNQYINQHTKDLFGNGEEAMRNRLYPDAVRCFEKYLSTARSSAGQENGSRDEVARAHFCAAVCLLAKSPPRYKLPRDIDRINVHLDQARQLAPEYPVFHQASVLWAIVKEDHYEFDGQEVPNPSVEELRASIPHLTFGDLEVFHEHVARLAAKSWRLLAERAGTIGREIEIPDEDTARQVDRQRPEAVRKYFTKTPDPVTLTRSIIALAAALVTVVAGFVLGGSMTVTLGAASFVMLVVSGARFVGYQAYLQQLAAAEPKPSDDQMDSWLRDDLDALAHRAARRLRLNTRPENEGGDLLIRPLTVVGIPDDKDKEYLGRSGRVYVEKGKDKKLRASLYDVYVLFLTRDLVSTYRCVLRFSTGDIIFDAAQEYHYRDVVGVHSWSVPIPGRLLDVLESEQGLGTAPSLVEQGALTFTSGQWFEINIGIASRGHRDVVEVAWQNRHALNILQKMIRAHHNE